MIFQAVQPKSIEGAGQEFLCQLIQHFTNDDRPDVLELELEAEEEQ